MNMGAYYHIQPRMHSCMRANGREVTGPLRYFGREPAASTATGFGQVHAKEQKILVDGALGIESNS